MKGRTPNRDLITVVDDDAAMRESTCLLIRAFGFEAEAFASAQEFLASAERNRTACLILDVRLPGMSGLDLFSELTASRRSLPTIFITAHVDAAVAGCVTKPGVVSVLYKPFQPAALLKAVRSAIARSLP